MKFARFMALIAALVFAPSSTFAQMQQGIQSQCGGDNDCIKKKAEEETVSRASSYFQFAYGKPNGESIFINDLCYAGGSAPINPSNYRYRDISSIYSSTDCENYAKAIFAKWTAQWTKKISDYEDEKKAKDREERRKAELEKQATATREADLKSGRIKPRNLGEAAIAHNAEIGVDLASAPKVRPDGKLYALPGKIAIADSETEFVAQLTLGAQNDALFRMTGRGHEIDSRYYYVKIPRSLRDYYLNNGQIGKGFDLVGKYVANGKYKTVSGQEKAAPVFEAVYFVMWQ